MSLLQFISIVSSVVFILFWIDLFKRKKMNVLHFIVFLWWLWILILFSVNVNLLNKFWKYFWVARWADLLVYIGLIILFYFYFELLNWLTKNKIQLSKLISYEAIQKWYEEFCQKYSNFKNKTKLDNFIIHIRIRNEEKTIEQVFKKLSDIWFNKFIFVNDGSQDWSLNILKNIQNKYKTKMIIIISHSINRWWWCANKTWFEFIKRYYKKIWINYIITFDADDQMNSNDALNFTNIIEKQKNIDIILWSRFLKWWSSENIDFMRKIILFFARIITFLFYWIKISDPTSWLRLFTINAIKKINIISDWMNYANEINEQIKKHKLKFIQKPIKIIYTDYSKNKWQKNSNSIKLWFEMIYKKLFFK